MNRSSTLRLETIEKREENCDMLTVSGNDIVTEHSSFHYIYISSKGSRIYRAICIKELVRRFEGYEHGAASLIVDVSPNFVC
jgi:hypothetical protein